MQTDNLHVYQIIQMTIALQQCVLWEDGYLNNQFELKFYRKVVFIYHTNLQLSDYFGKGVIMVMALLVYCTSHAGSDDRFYRKCSQQFKNQYYLHTTVTLCNAITKCNYYLLREYIHSFCDTLPMLREHISTKTTSFSLETLIRNIIGCTYDAHDAVKIVNVGRNLFNTAVYLLMHIIWNTISLLPIS